VGGCITLFRTGRGQEGVPHCNVLRGVCRICGGHNAGGRMSQAEEGANSLQLQSKILPCCRQRGALGRADGLIRPAGPSHLAPLIQPRIEKNTVHWEYLMPSQQVKTEHVFPRSLDRQRATLRCAQVIVGQEMCRLRERQRSQCRQSAAAVPCRRYHLPYHAVGTIKPEVKGLLCSVRSHEKYSHQN
jgi:hypothetical protein